MVNFPILLQPQTESIGWMVFGLFSLSKGYRGGVGIERQRRVTKRTDPFLLHSLFFLECSTERTPNCKCFTFTGCGCNKSGKSTIKNGNLEPLDRIANPFAAHHEILQPIAASLLYKTI
jgi:hypothetical protein